MEGKIDQRKIHLLKNRISELESLLRVEQSKNRAQNDFFTKMNHEIRTPLNSILGFSQILSSIAKDELLPDQFERYLDCIWSSGNELSEVVSHFSELVQKGRLEDSNSSKNNEDLIGPSDYSIWGDIPAAQRLEVQQGLEELSQIPFFLTDQLLEQCNRLKTICGPFKAPIFLLLDEVISAFIRFDETEFFKKIEEIRNGTNSGSG